jgi:multidrug resistance efflux pump
MKSINFKRQESVLRYTDEQKPKKKKINWDRIVYFLILGLVIFFLIRWVVLNTLYIEADGQVIFESRNIQNVDDSRIIEFKYEEGDEVEEGDTLFTYINDEDEKNANAAGGYGQSENASSLSVGDITINKVKSPDWIDKEIFSTKKQMALNNSQIRENKKLIGSLSANIARLEQEVVLDVIPKSRLDDINMSIDRLEADIIQQQSENSYYYSYLAELERLKALQDAQPKDSDNKGINLSSDSNSSSGNGEEEDPLRYFISPIEGTITRIFYSNYEVALKSDVIMSIHKPENIKIKAYVSQEDIDEFKIGDEVEIVFPDDSKSTGYIEKFHFTTSRLPEEFQKKYEPTTRSILVDVIPTSPAAAKKWQAYYKIAVIVRKSKY